MDTISSSEPQSKISKIYTTMNKYIKSSIIQWCYWKISMVWIVLYMGDILSTIPWNFNSVGLNFFFVNKPSWELINVEH